MESCSDACSPSRMCSELVDARIEATDGFADVATLSGAEAFDERREGADRRRGDDLEKLCARLAEVFAQRLGLLDALGFEQLLEQRHARAAGRACLGAALEAGTSLQPLGDGVGEIALGDVVARADLRGGRQRADTQSPRRRRIRPARSARAHRQAAASPTIGRRIPYADASPTRMPPSKVFASSERTSLA